MADVLGLFLILAAARKKRYGSARSHIPDRKMKMPQKTTCREFQGWGYFIRRREMRQKTNLQVASFRRQISMNCLISDTSAGIFASLRFSRAILTALVPFLGLPVFVVLSGIARVYPKAAERRVFLICLNLRIDRLVGDQKWHRIRVTVRSAAVGSSERQSISPEFSKRLAICNGCRKLRAAPGRAGCRGCHRWMLDARYASVRCRTSPCH